MDPSVSPVLHHLVNKHVITVEEERSLVNEKNPTLRGEIFVDLFAQKGFNAFRELCNCLEMDCPHLLTSLLLDSTGKIKIFYRVFLYINTYTLSAKSLKLMILFIFLVFSVYHIRKHIGVKLRKCVLTKE